MSAAMWRKSFISSQTVIDFSTLPEKCLVTAHDGALRLHCLHFKNVKWLQFKAFETSILAVPVLSIYLYKLIKIKQLEADKMIFSHEKLENQLLIKLISPLKLYDKFTKPQVKPSVVEIQHISNYLCINMLMVALLH
ncbi:hypothetical protein GOODEAATRI_012898 [Goodea atripinnis]|uniref:Uncharacterized protein n=1 Tax=Goodea atripinnis TaxID=208336 RepID=A0ABV0P3X5_9TELE